MAEISKEDKIKLFLQPTKLNHTLLEDPNITWKVTKQFNGTSLDKTCEGLVQFCTKISMSNVLMQLLLTPPICNQKYVRAYAETKVAPIKANQVINNLNPS